MNKSGWLAVAGLVLVLTGIMYYFLRDEPLTNTEPAASGPSGPAALLTFTGTSYIEEENGKRLWELTAEAIEADNANKRAYLHNIKGVFYQDNGGKIDLTAKEAVVCTDIKDIILEGDVKAVSSVDGAAFTAPKALWRGKDKRFQGSGGITLTKKDVVVTGEQIESDANMEKVVVKGKAKVIKGGDTP